MTDEDHLDDDPRRLARPTDPPTSHEAAEAVAETAHRRRREVLRHVHAAGKTGATMGEVALAMGVDTTTVSSRLTELRRAGLIVPTGEKRKGPRPESRRQAVYVMPGLDLPADVLPGDLDLARLEDASRLDEVLADLDP